MLTGHCLCGEVRYEAGGALSHETVCHCSICRRSSAAPCVAWFTVPAGALRFVAGQPTSFKSTEHGTRSFCARCGTPLTFRSTRYPDEVDITTCSLDDPERLPPKDHTHAVSQLSWLRIADGLPVYAGARPD